MILVPPACVCQPASETHGMAMIRDPECTVHGYCPGNRHMTLCRLHGCPCECHASHDRRSRDAEKDA